MKSKYRIAVFLLKECKNGYDVDMIITKTILEFEESKSGARKVFRHVCDEAKVEK